MRVLNNLCMCSTFTTSSLLLILPFAITSDHNVIKPSIPHFCEHIDNGKLPAFLLKKNLCGITSSVSCSYIEVHCFVVSKLIGQSSFCLEGREGCECKDNQTLRYLNISRKNRACPPLYGPLLKIAPTLSSPILRLSS